MTRKVLGLVLMALVAAVVPACGDSSDENATGSNECCKVRNICANCICSNGQIDAGFDDRLGPCQAALDSWHGIGCSACQDKNCLASC